MTLIRALFFSHVIVFTLLFLSGCATQQNNNYFEKAQKNYAQKDYVLTFEELNIGVKRKDPKALYAMGYMYYYGLGVGKDQDLGRSLIRRAAKANYPSAITAMQLITQRRHNQYAPFQKYSKNRHEQLAENSKPHNRDTYT